MPSPKIVERILATPAPRPWWNRNLFLKKRPPTTTKSSRILAGAGADLDRSALALGRSAKAIVWHARTLGVTVPAEWAKRTPEKRVTGKRQTPDLVVSAPALIQLRCGSFSWFLRDGIF